MFQLENKILKEIIVSLKDQRFLGKSQEISELLDRLKRLRRNMFVSSGAFIIFILAEITVSKVNVGFVQGSIKNPEIIPLAMFIAYIYYFRLYFLHHRKLLKEVDFEKGIFEDYHEQIAQNAARLKIEEAFINSSDFKINGDTVTPIIAVFQNVPRENPEKLKLNFT